jgi:hypothetical protein
MYSYKSIISFLKAHTRLPTFPPRTLRAAPAPDGKATRAPAHKRRISPLY